MKNPYLDWEPYNHPQLGQVEIGGWNRILVERNAPESMLEEIAEKHREFSIKIAATLPKLSIKDLVYEHLKKISCGLLLRSAIVVIYPLT